MAITMREARNRIAKIFAKYNDSEVRAGYLSGATYNDGTPLSEVASKHENGIDVPKRPFMTFARDTNIDRWRKGLSRALASGVPMDRALALMGERMVSDIKKSILQGEWGNNGVATIARKGFDKPLVDTGAMSRSIEYEVIIKGETVR
jgi:hypothetical protein